MENMFYPAHVAEIINRLDKLTPTTKPIWGKMSAAQMLAHCCVSYELVYENNHPQPNAFTKFLLKLFLKNLVVSEKKEYKHNSRTSPDFLIKDEKNFDVEKKRLIDYLKKTQELGEDYFDGKESHSFGKLTKQEWNVMFFKHLNHHLKQFGV